MDDVTRDPLQQSGPKPFQLALGLERLGLISLRFPIVCAVIVVILAVGAAFGVARIKADDFLSQLFRSDTPQFKQYEEVTKQFPSSEFDVLVVVEGKTLLERESVEKLRDLVTDLQLIDAHARRHLAVLRAPAAGGRPSSRAAVSRGVADAARTMRRWSRTC